MDIIGRAAQLFGNSPALIMAGRQLSFEECDKQSENIADNLYRAGVCSGEIVAIVSPNATELVMLLLGVLKAGMIAAPLNYRVPEQLVSKTLEKLRPSIVFTTGEEPHIKRSGIKTASVTSIIENTLPCTAPDAFEGADMMERPVTIIHTSASSGEPKAAVHSFANHWYSALGSNENISFGPGECWLLSLPLYHIGGYSLLFRSLISGGALAVGQPDEALDQSLRNFPLTHLSVVPTQLYRLLANKESTAMLQKLKAVLLGGSAAPTSLIEEADRQKIPLYLSYGSTEMSSQITTTSAPIHGIQNNSGKVLPYREIKMAKDGELLVKGPCLFQGYLQAGTIVPQTDQEGWFHTSDIGHVTDDGTVTIVGRKDNMFISGGENIHPEEIEKALVMINGIMEALVVPVPDNEYGQRPVAFIKTVEKKRANDDAITLKMHAAVGKLKSPILYFRVEQWVTLPGSQKINRAWYRKLASEP